MATLQPAEYSNNDLKLAYYSYYSDMCDQFAHYDKNTDQWIYIHRSLFDVKPVKRFYDCLHTLATDNGLYINQWQLTRSNNKVIAHKRSKHGNRLTFSVSGKTFFIYEY
jgi:hypothetical protein